MRYIKALVLLAAAGGFAQTANAADFGALPYSAPAGPAPIVELGTGWYIRGDIGGGEGALVQFTGDLKVPETRTTWTGDLGFGYKLTNYLRTDLTVTYFKPQHLNITSGKTIICPYSLLGLTNQVTGFKEGYLYSAQSGTCTGSGTAELGQANALASGYVDLGTYFGITPYVGGGAGLARVQATGYSDYYKTSDGSAYRTDLSIVGDGYPGIWTDANGRAINPQPRTPTGKKLSFGPQDYSQRSKKTYYNFAWAVMGGFAYNITDQAAIDVGYQYVSNGTFKSTPGSDGKVVKRDLSVQQVKVGFRYQID